MFSIPFILYLTLSAYSIPPLFILLSLSLSLSYALFVDKVYLHLSVLYIVHFKFQKINRRKGGPPEELGDERTDWGAYLNMLG